MIDVFFKLCPLYFRFNPGSSEGNSSSEIMQQHPRKLKSITQRRQRLSSVTHFENSIRWECGAEKKRRGWGREAGGGKSCLNIKFGFYHVVPDTCLTAEVWSLFPWQSSVRVNFEASKENAVRQFDLDKVQLVSKQWGVESGWVLVIWGWWRGLTCMRVNGDQPGPEWLIGASCPTSSSLTF